MFTKYLPPGPHWQTLWRDNQHEHLGTLRGLSRALDARDSYTLGHSQRVAEIAYELAHHYGLSQAACQEIYVAGMLHDIGKIGIPDSVLLKQDALTDAEFRLIQQHPQIGYRIVEQLGQFQFALPGILYHHERWDGAGYPQGLQGEAIPIMGRILAVADAFDAMTSSRPYRQAMPREKAYAIIRAGAGQQWEPGSVAAFSRWYSALNVSRTVPPPSRARGVRWDRTRLPDAALLR